MCIFAKLMLLQNRVGIGRFKILDMVVFIAHTDLISIMFWDIVIPQIPSKHEICV